MIWGADMPPDLPPHRMAGNPFLLLGLIYVGTAIVVLGLCEVISWL